MNELLQLDRVLLIKEELGASIARFTFQHFTCLNVEHLVILETLRSSSN